MILASYFTQDADPQRGHRWQWENDNPLKLIASAERHSIPLTIFSDAKIPVNYTYTPCNGYPSAWRWFVYREWLKLNQPEYVFMVDSTDVEIITPPKIKANILYVGDEPATFQRQAVQRWFNPQVENSPTFIKDFYKQAIKENYQVLNAGIVGGDYNTVMVFLNQMCTNLEHTFGVEGVRDMPALNYTVRNCGPTFEHGYPINSVFRAHKAKEGVWFKHK